MPDAITLLTSDHRRVDQLFDRYEQLPADDHNGRRELVDEMIRELSVHAAIEEQFLYPWIDEHVPEGGQLASEGIDEHQQAKEALAALEDMDASTPQFDAKARELIADVRHHVEEEENEFFPRLREAADPQQLEQLGDRMEQGKSVAPTRPHPRAPSTPPGNLAAGPTAGLVDRVKDAFTQDDDRH